MQTQCPQCGSAVLIAYEHKSNTFSVYCTGCEVMADKFPSRQKAEEAWDSYWEQEWELGNKVIYKC